MASTVGHVLPVAMDVHMHVDLRAAAALPQRPKPKPKHYCDTADTVTRRSFARSACSQGGYLAAHIFFYSLGDQQAPPNLPREHGLWFR